MPDKTVRLSKVLKELSVGIDTAVEYLAKIGITISRDLNEKLPIEAFTALMKEFRPDLELKIEADKKVLPTHDKQLFSIENVTRKPNEAQEKVMMTKK